MNIINHCHKIVACFQAINSHVESVNEYDNGKFIIGIEKGYYLSGSIGMLTLEELREVYRKLVRGDVIIRECNSMRSIPGRGGPIGAPSFLKGTW